MATKIDQKKPHQPKKTTPKPNPSQFIPADFVYSSKISGFTPQYVWIKWTVTDFWPVRLHRSRKSNTLLFLIPTQSLVHLLFFNPERIPLIEDGICFLDISHLFETFFMFLLLPYLMNVKKKEIADKKFEIFFLKIWVSPSSVNSLGQNNYLQNKAMLEQYQNATPWAS